MDNYYSESRVQIKGFAVRRYDMLMNVTTFGRYFSFIEKVIELMKIKSANGILDSGISTGRNTCLKKTI